MATLLSKSLQACWSSFHKPCRMSQLHYSISHQAVKRNFDLPNGKQTYHLTKETKEHVLVNIFPFHEFTPQRISQRIPHVVIWSPFFFLVAGFQVTSRAAKLCLRDSLKACHLSLLLCPSIHLFHHSQCTNLNPLTWPCLVLISRVRSPHPWPTLEWFNPHSNQLCFTFLGSSRRNKLELFCLRVH